MTYGEMFTLFLKEHPEYEAIYIDWRPQGRYEIKIWVDSNEVIFVKWNEILEVFELKTSDSDANEGCEFCNGDKTYSQNVNDDSYDLDFYNGKISVTASIIGKITNGGSLSIYRDDIEFSVNYCPMCGRKL